MNKRKVTIIGAGFVGMSMGTLLAKNSKVMIYDIDKDVVNKINAYESPVYDKSISMYFDKYKENISATNNILDIPYNSQFFIIATPTDYDESSGLLDVSNVESGIELALKVNENAIIIIKSTVPIGFTENATKKYKTKNIIFSPEFLREGTALEDNLNPSRIIIGGGELTSKSYVSELSNSISIQNPNIIYMTSSEAESVKLFSNTFLAMRVAFFNELDTYALATNMSSNKIITGVCADERIGNYYNNPSFGYGGYCLPKDSKQLLANFESIPQDLIKSIISSNAKRKKFIAKEIIKKKIKNVGIYKLSMKTNSKNSKESAILEIIQILLTEKINVVVYDPDYDGKLKNVKFTNNLQNFKDSSDLIITNRIDTALDDVSNKVFSRDIFKEN